MEEKVIAIHLERPWQLKQLEGPVCQREEAAEKQVDLEGLHVQSE
jgi:hypothetical protein